MEWRWQDAVGQPPLLTGFPLLGSPPARFRQHHYVSPLLVRGAAARHSTNNLSTPVPQLPCLIFSMLTLAFMLDHTIFSNRTLRERTKAIAFGVIASSIVGVWAWYRNIAWGMEGPVNDVSDRATPAPACRARADTARRAAMGLEVEVELERVQLGSACLPAAKRVFA